MISHMILYIIIYILGDWNHQLVPSLLRQNQTPSPQESPALAKFGLLDFCPNRRICCWWRKETSPVSRTAPPMAGRWRGPCHGVHEEDDAGDGDYILFQLFISMHSISNLCTVIQQALRCPLQFPKKWTAQTTTGRWGQSARQLGQFVSV